MCCTFIVERMSILACEQLHHIFKSLVVLAARNVGMRQFIHQNDARLARENGVYVHLFKRSSPEFKPAKWKSIELGG